MGKMHQDVTESCTKTKNKKKEEGNICSISKFELNSSSTSHAANYRVPRRRCKRLQPDQKASLIEYMSRHPVLAKNKFAPSVAELKKKEEEWGHLAAKLNKMGTQKTVTQWRVTWRDLVSKSKTQREAKAMNKAMATEEVPDSMNSSDEDYGEINKSTVWKKKILNIMKSSDEESSEDDIQTVTKHSSRPIFVPANATSELRSPSSQLNSPEHTEFESDSPCPSPTLRDMGPVKRRSKRSTTAQIQAMVDCMALNPSMGFGAQESKIADWQRLAELLNTMGPPKQVAKWQLAWGDMKSKALSAAKKKRRMKDDVPLPPMKQKITEINAAYKESLSIALDELKDKFDELPCPTPTEGMPVLFARSLSPPSRLNSPDLDNFNEISIDCIDSVQYSEVSARFNFGQESPGRHSDDQEDERHNLAKLTSQRNSEQMSPVRENSEVFLGERNTGDVYNKQRGSRHESRRFNSGQMSPEPVSNDCNRSKNVSPGQSTSSIMSSLRYSSDLSPGIHSSDDVSNERRNFSHVSSEPDSSDKMASSVKSAHIPSVHVKDSSVQLKNKRNSDDSILPKTNRETHARSTPEQIQALVNCMALNLSMGFGVQTSKDIEDWQRLRKLLNTMGPPKRVVEWQRTWRDMKHAAVAKKQRTIKAGTCLPPMTKKITDIIASYKESQSAVDEVAVGENDQISPVNNFNQMSPQHNTDRESPVNFDQMSPVKFGQMSSGYNNCQVNSGKAGDFETSAESDIEVDPPLNYKHKRIKIVRSSHAQVKALVNYMSTHPALAKSEEKGPVAVEKRQLEWRRLGKSLNKMGHTKSTNAWKRTWRDLKRSARTAKTSNFFQSQIYQQILNIMSSAKDGPMESDTGAVEKDDSLPMLCPTERNNGQMFIVPRSDELNNVSTRHKDSGKDSQQGSSVPHNSDESNNVSIRLKDSGTHSQQMSSLGQSNNISTRLKDFGKHSQQMPSLPLGKREIELLDSDQSKDVSIRRGGRERRVERTTQTRCSKAQIAALADYMTANPGLATCQYKGPCADDPKIAGWRQLSKYLNRMGVARSATGWKQIWQNIVTSVRKSQQPNDWDEKISRKVLEAVGDETTVKNYSELTIDIVEESGQMGPVNNFNQMSPQHNTDRESPVNFDQMSPMHNSVDVSPIDFDQMSSLYNSSRVSPVDFDQISLGNIDQMSPTHNTGQVDPLQSLDNTVNFGHTSPVHNNRQSPVNTGQISPVKFGQMSSGQVNSGQAGHIDSSSVESDIEDPPLYSKHKTMKIIRSSRAQVKALVNYMSTHPALARSEEKGPVAVEKRQLEWRRLGKRLNKMGHTKSTEAWKRTWCDLKRNARTAKNSRSFHAQIYRQVLNIMSSAKDGPIESDTGAVEKDDSLPIPCPTERNNVQMFSVPRNDELNNASTRHKDSGKDGQQVSSEPHNFDESNDVSTSLKDSGKHQQKTSLGQSNNRSTRLKDFGKHSQQKPSVSSNSDESDNVPTIHIDSGKDSLQLSLPLSQTSNVSARHKESLRHCHLISPVSRTSGKSNNVSTRSKESDKDSLQMPSVTRTSKSSKIQLFRHIETKDWGGGRERRVERTTQTRKQLNSLVDCVYAHPALASEHETSNPRHHKWRTIGKFLNKMGPIYCTDIAYWKNRWKELKHDVARRWKKDGTYTGCIDSIRIKKVLELVAKYPSERTDSDIEIVEDMKNQAPTTHHHKSVQHKVVEILSRNHTVDRDSINAGSKERIDADTNANGNTAGRGSVESYQDRDEASSTTTSNVSSDATNNLLKELIGELKRSNDLKIEQNGLLKQLVKQFSSDAKSSHNKRENQTVNDDTPLVVIQKQEVEELTEGYATNTKNTERSEQHSGAYVEDRSHKKDKVNVESSFLRMAATPQKPQIPISSKEGTTSSPKKQIRTVEISRLIKPSLFKPTQPIQRVVKLKAITKVPKMPKINLLRLKDGTMVLMPGTKLPASNDEYQTFVVGSVKHADSEKVVENETEPAGFEDYEF